MTNKDIILAIDQGTTGTTVLLIDKNLNVLAKKNTEFPQYYPQPGWVEHDANEIWSCTVGTIQDALAIAGVDPSRIAGIGITNQRETTTIWNRKTSQPIHNSIVWQDRRTADICQALIEKDRADFFFQKTGLVLDAYFSGTKIKWMLDHVSGARDAAIKGDLAFGTIDTFLVWKLTNGHSHVTDVSNASRTLLMDLKTLQWDDTLLDLLTVPYELLPEIRSNAEVYGVTHNVPGLPDGIPVSGMAGDQQAALFGQACFKVGEAKCTYGTGAFILLNTGSDIRHSKNRLLTTVAWQLNGKTTYALEGSAFIAGAAVQWLRDGLKIITSSAEVETLAAQVPDSGGVVFVPALAGLGAPYWNPAARGVIHGITRGTTSAHLARATLDGIAHQVDDLLVAMAADLGHPPVELKVDGGACANNLLMQYQADLLGVNVVRPKMIETTAFGSAFLAGLGVGLWKTQDEILQTWKIDRQFNAAISRPEAEKKRSYWKSVVEKA